MKTWAVVSARSSGLLAIRKKLAGPLLKIDPCAVTSSSTIRFTGMLDRNASRSQRLNASIPWAPSLSELTRSTSPHFNVQKSTYSGRSSRRSTSLVRLSGSLSARNSSTSSGAGVVPITSSIARRRNSASEQSGDGTSPSSRHLAAALTSMMFCGREIQTASRGRTGRSAGPSRPAPGSGP